MQFTLSGVENSFQKCSYSFPARSEKIEIVSLMLLTAVPTSVFASCFSSPFCTAASFPSNLL